MGELPTSSRQPSELGAHERSQTRGGRRHSATLRRVARNAETFSRNRNHRVRRISDDVSVPSSHRARVRASARTRAEQQQPQQQSTPDADETERGANALNNIDSQPEFQSSASFGNWKPSIALGTALWLDGEDLNAIQIADRKVAQTRYWVDYYQGGPAFVRMHQEAVQAREQLDEAAQENTTPRSAPFISTSYAAESGQLTHFRSSLHSVQESAIQKRLEHLRHILQDSRFPPEHANIQAAITGYESGTIPYSDSYTLIWAGQIVDTCSDFDSFTVDRSTRLDQYCAEYGLGWLWYEPPLAGGEITFRGPTIVVKKGLCLENKPNWRHGTENMGHYRIQMGFRRRKTTVARENISPFSTTAANSNHRNLNDPGPKPRRRSITAAATTPRTPTIPQPNTSLPGTTAPDATGPRIFWDMLLDTGATLPCLYEGDIAKLKIDRDTYAAQSSRTISTADSVVQARVYELDVCVCTDEDGPRPVGPPPPTPSSAISPSSVFLASPVTRSATAAKLISQEKKDREKEKDKEEKERRALSCTIPVIAFAGDSADHTTGNQAPDRLSGILPLHMCYTSSAPGNFKLWMGRERREVLGTGRLPGYRRYGEVLGGENAQVVSRAAPKKLGRWPPARDLGTPDRVVFEHNLADGTGRVVRDEEDTEGGKIVLSGPSVIDFDRLGVEGATVKEVEVLRIKRKKQPAALEKLPTLAKPPAAGVKQPAAPAKQPAAPAAPAPAKPAPTKLLAAPTPRPAKRRRSEVKSPTRKRTKSERADGKA